MKRKDEATDAFKKQIEISPNDCYAHDNLSISLAALKNYPEALREEEIAVTLVPDDVSKLMRLGRLQLKTAHPDEARKTFEKVLVLPHDSMTENNVAYELADAGIDLEKDWQLITAALASESLETRAVLRREAGAGSRAVNRHKKRRDCRDGETANEAVRLDLRSSS